MPASAATAYSNITRRRSILSAGDPYEPGPNAASSSRETVSASSGTKARMISRSVSRVRMRESALPSACPRRTLLCRLGPRGRLAFGLGLRRLPCAFGLCLRLHALRQLLTSSATIPSLIDLWGDLAGHEELREFATLRLALDRHSKLQSRSAARR